MVAEIKPFVAGFTQPLLIHPYCWYLPVMKMTVFSKKWLIMVLHAMAWTLLFALPFILRPTYDDPSEGKKEQGSDGFLFYVVNNAFWIGLFYLNAFLLIPKIMYQKKHTVYALTHLFLFGCFILIGWVNMMLLRDQPHITWRVHILFTTFIYLFILAASIAFKTSGDRIKADKLAQEKENENLKTELSLLRSQVSPHFMFNVLNNMVALARKQSEQLEPSLIKLSSLMRYMLYDADGDKVSLEKEIDYLQSYIDLQKQRFGKNVTVITTFNNTENSCEIEPMLLIPFVENAFKHGTVFIEDARIEIELAVKKSLLNFTVRNRFNEASEEIKDATSGIGLANVKRRLNLLYGKNHSLQINKKEGWFITTLQLNLQP